MYVFCSAILTIAQTDEIKILKLGGNIVTKKQAKTGVARVNRIRNIAKEISHYKGKLIVIHGAGSFGHPLAKKYKLDKSFSATGAILTHNSVRALNEIIVKALHKEGIKAIGIEPMSCVICKNGRIKQMQTDQIKHLLNYGFVPVLFGDMVMDTHKKTCILSGDQIITYLAKEFKVSTIGCGTSEDGVYDIHGKTIKHINLNNFDECKKSIKGSNYTDTTGGMLGKIKELLAIPGITSFIFNASKKGNITRFLQGKKTGTTITT